MKNEPAPRLSGRIQVKNNIGPSYTG